MKRRELLLGMGLASVAIPLYVRAAQTSEDASKQIVNLLFVQSAHGAELSNGVLRLKTVNPATILFSDRPDRVTGHEPTEDFVDDWDEGDDSFKSNPPNATLSILTGPEPQEIVLVLKSPRLDKGDLLYDVEILDGPQKASGDASSLFIDTIGRPLTPVSVAGVHRRHRRRRAHHRH
ncbi:MAG: hypothetical protein ACERLB_12060 [Gammaproteobacteria bacterium]